MAQFDAQIDLQVQIDRALGQVKKVEKALDDINKKVISPKIDATVKRAERLGEAFIAPKGFKALNRELDNIKNRANTAEKVVARLVEGLATAQLTTAGLRAAGNSLKDLSVQAGTAVDSLNGLGDIGTKIERTLVPGFSIAQDSISTLAKTVSTAEFRLNQLLSVTEGIGNFVQSIGTANAATAALSVGLTAVAFAAEAKLKQSLNDVETAGTKALQNLQFEADKAINEFERLKRSLEGTVAQFRELEAKGRTRFDNVVPTSDEGRRAANTIIKAQENLERLRRDQEDVIRRSKGLTQSSLEENKAIKSLEIKRRLEERSKTIKDEEAALQQALNELDRRGISLLQQKLDYEQRITNQKTLQEQRARRAQFRPDGEGRRPQTGLPYTPYTDAAFQGFPGVALPETPQEAKIRAAARERAAAAAALQQQKVNSLLTQGVTDLRIQLALVEKLGPAYQPFLAGLEKANRRQSQLFRATQNRATRQDLGAQTDRQVKAQQKILNESVRKEQIIKNISEQRVLIRNNEFEKAQQLIDATETLIRKEQKALKTRKEASRFRRRQAQEAEREARRAAAKAKRDRERQIEELAQGVGFPLLFGGGIGEIIGSGIGALKGPKGFGGQLVGGAIGRVFDDLFRNLDALAASLVESGDAIAALETANVKVDGRIKSLVETLEDAGQAAAAYQLAQKELNKAYGANAQRDLEAYDAAGQRLSDAFKRISSGVMPPLIRLTTAAKDALAGLVNVFVDFVEGIRDGLRFLAGNQGATGDRARPDFRLEGQFLQPSANLRELARRSQEQRLNGTSTFKNSLVYREYELQKKSIEERQSAVDRLNAGEKKIAQLKQEERDKINNFEQERLKLATERARVEADSLRRQLEVQSQIRNLELERLKLKEQSDAGFAQAQGTVAEAGLQALQLPGVNAPENTVTRLFALLDRLDAAKVKAFREELIKLSAQGADLPADDLKQYVAAYEDYLQAITLGRQREFKTFDQQLQESLDETQAKLQRELNLRNAISKEEKRAVEISNRVSELREKFPDATGAQLAPLIKLIIELTKPLDTFQKKIDDLIGTINQELANAMQNALLTTLKAAITGADDLNDKLQEIAASLLETLSQILMQAAIAAALGPGGFFGPKGLPGFREKGGPVKGNDPYIVGEGGPELFIPKESGTIVPNNRLQEALEAMVEPRMSGGTVTANRPYKVGEAGAEMFVPDNPYDVARSSMVSSGQTVQAKTEEAKEEERYEEMTNSLSNDVNIRYDSTVINNQNYVTEEQFRTGMTQGFKQARAETLRQMRNRPAIRSKAGI